MFGASQAALPEEPVALACECEAECHAPSEASEAAAAMQAERACVSALLLRGECLSMEAHRSFV